MDAGIFALREPAPRAAALMADGDLALIVAAGAVAQVGGQGTFQESSW